MAKEIERKFLLKGDEWRTNPARSFSLVQFYVAAGPDRSVRVRIRDGETAMLTLKFGAGTFERDEFEYEIPLADAMEMRRFAKGMLIEKTRHIVPVAGHLFEVDVFHGALDGFVMAELETAETVDDSALPGWLGREVTGDPAYTNSSLAIAGAPKLS